MGEIIKGYEYENSNLHAHRFTKDIPMSLLQILKDVTIEDNVRLQLQILDHYIIDQKCRSIYLYMTKNLMTFIFGQAIARAIDSNATTNITYDNVLPKDDKMLNSLQYIISKSNKSVTNLTKKKIGSHIVIRNTIYVNKIEPNKIAINIHYRYAYINNPDDKLDIITPNAQYQPLILFLSLAEAFTLVEFVSRTKFE